jgi:mannose-6-phosphate isomerase-like protein (cupin superfamily)
MDADGSRDAAGTAPPVPSRVNLAEKLSIITDYWSPKIVASVNGVHVKLVKLKGEFVWHAHEAEDELFLVVEGTLRMQFRDREVTLGRGECLLVPHGTEHRPVADDEAHVLLVEPATTVNTGSAGGERTREADWLQD